MLAGTEIIIINKERKKTEIHQSNEYSVDDDDNNNNEVVVIERVRKKKSNAARAEVRLLFSTAGKKLVQNVPICR